MQRGLGGHRGILGTHLWGIQGALGTWGRCGKQSAPSRREDPLHAGEGHEARRANAEGVCPPKFLRAHPAFFHPLSLQAAFTCIKQLWNRRPLKVYGGRMAESMLAILCHILRGEPLIRERLGREREGSRGEEETGGEEGGPRREPQVNQQQLQQVGTGEWWVAGGVGDFQISSCFF